MSSVEFEFTDSKKHLYVFSVSVYGSNRDDWFIRIRCFTSDTSSWCTSYRYTSFLDRGNIYPSDVMRYVTRYLNNLAFL